jgi:choline dehydrogenase-like flavoprotein
MAGPTRPSLLIKKLSSRLASSNTPKLLELSGVGSKDVLSQHGIPLVVELHGVGENLQDHFMAGVSYELTDNIMTGDPLMRQEPEALIHAQKLYEEHQPGPFTIGGIQPHAFMPTPDVDQIIELLKAQSQLRGNEYHSIIQSIIENRQESSATWFIFFSQVNLHESGKSLVGTALQSGNFARFGCSQSHPFSRGSTHISSADVDAKPHIDPRDFPHPADLEIMVRHVQGPDKLRNADALAAVFKPDGSRNHPDAHHVGELERAKKYVLVTAVSTYHSCGIATMLPKEKGMVVNHDLRVYGTENLGIVDASIFPLIPRGNPLSLVYAVAEKAADIIKGL